MFHVEHLEAAAGQARRPKSRPEEYGTMRVSRETTRLSDREIDERLAAALPPGALFAVGVAFTPVAGFATAAIVPGTFEM